MGLFFLLYNGAAFDPSPAGGAVLKAGSAAGGGRARRTDQRPPRSVGRRPAERLRADRPPLFSGPVQRFVGCFIRFSFDYSFRSSLQIYLANIFLSISSQNY